MSHISGRLRAQGRPSLTGSQLKGRRKGGGGSQQILLLSARSTVKRCVILFNCISLLLRHTISFVTCKSGHKLDPHFCLHCLVLLAYCCRMFSHCSSQSSLRQTSLWLRVSLLMPNTQFSFLSSKQEKENCFTSWICTGVFLVKDFYYCVKTICDIEL